MVWKIEHTTNKCQLNASDDGIEVEVGDVELSFYLFSYNVEGLPPLEPVGGSHGDVVGVSVRLVRSGSVVLRLSSSSVRLVRMKNGCSAADA